MRYIFLVAGEGSRLHPLTLKQPKSCYKLDKNTTVLQRMIHLIRRYDADADIVAVTGFMHNVIEDELGLDIKCIFNPFYKVTNSIASLWFVKEYLETDQVVIINGDIVMSDSLVKNLLCKAVTRPYVLIDTSIKINGDYNVEVSGDRILVMSKKLDTYKGEYAGVSKLDRESAMKLKICVEKMVDRGMYDQWYENALVQMIFDEDFNLFFEDISEYSWTEVDCVSDLLKAKEIHMDSWVKV